MKRKLIAITGPSCGGKTTLKKKIVQATAGRVVPVVTSTTREARVGETDGRDYHFRSRQAFERLIKDRSLMEWMELDDNLYGVEKRAIEVACDSDRAAIIVVNPDGILALRPWCCEKGIEMVSVCATASMGTLRQRLAGRRAVASESEVRRRASRLEQEVHDCLSRAGCDLLVSGSIARSVGSVLRAVG